MSETRLFNRPNIDDPLSKAIGLPDWEFRQSRYGRIHQINPHFWIREIVERDYDLAWRVTDVFLPDEDTTIARYWCYDQNGVSVAHPDIYVEWASGNKNPIDAQMHVEHDGGYIASVRSPYPSEGFSHGFVVVGYRVAVDAG